MTRPGLALISILENGLNALLWSALALLMIRFLSLQQSWYLVCFGIVALMAARDLLYLRVGLPRLLQELGYEVTATARAKLKYKWLDLMIFTVLLFTMAYVGVASGRL